MSKEKHFWKYTHTAFGWIWWNPYTHEIEHKFWRGLIRKFLNN